MLLPRAALVLAALLALAPLPVATSADERTWARFMDNAERAFQDGRYESGEGWVLDAVREAEAIDSKGPLLVQSLRKLAEVYRKQGKKGEAEAVLRRLSALGQQPGAYESTGADTVTSLEKYAAFLREIGRENDAAMVQIRAQRLRELRPGGGGSKLLYFNPVAELRDYAVLLRQRNREAEAKAIEGVAAAEARRLVERYRSLQQGASFGYTEPSLVWQMQMTVALEALEGRLYPEAQGLFEATVRNAEKFAVNDVRLATSLSYLALVHALQHDPAAAERAAQRALSILEQSAGSGHSLLPLSFTALAFSHLRADFQPAKALPYFQRALQVLGGALVRDHPVIGLHLAGLATCYLALSKTEQAKPPLERAIAIAEMQYQPQHVGLAIGLVHVADVYIAQGRYAEADAVMRRALAVLQKMLDPDHPDVVRARERYTLIQGELRGRARPIASLPARTIVPIQVVRNITLVHGVLNGSQRALLIVDTGAQSTLITPLLMTRLGMSIPKNAPRRQVTVVGGQKTEVPFVTLAVLQVGDARVENLDVAVFEAFPDAVEVDGLLGADFLHQFRVTLDKEARRMTLEPPGR